MSPFDHLFVLTFAVIYPIVGLIGYRRFVEKVKAGMPAHRSRLYLETASWQWVLFALGAIVWGISDREIAALGFGFEPNTRNLVGAALTAIGIALLFVQVRQVGEYSKEKLQEFHSSVGELSVMMPHNAGELARFNMLSVTAGIVEETLWRGYLFWYLGHVMPLWTAAIISAVGFGLAHSYQGLANVPRIVMVGAVFSGLYLLTGSLWMPILAHAALDLLQGRMVSQALRKIA